MANILETLRRGWTCEIVWWSPSTGRKYESMYLIIQPLVVDGVGRETTLIPGRKMEVRDVYTAKKKVIPYAAVMDIKLISKN